MVPPLTKTSMSDRAKYNPILIWPVNRVNLPYAISKSYLPTMLIGYDKNVNLCISFTKK